MFNSKIDEALPYHQCAIVATAAIDVDVVDDIIAQQTDGVEGEEHDHSITSKINLIDLAGSERQSLAKTSGDRLRVRYTGCANGLRRFNPKSNQSIDQISIASISPAK